MEDNKQKGWDNLTKNNKYEQLLANKSYVICDSSCILVKEGKHKVIIRDEQDGITNAFDVDVMLLKNDKNVLCCIIFLEEMDEEEICYDIKSKDKDSLVSKELAASVVHEIKNPLFSIRGFLQLLDKSFVKGDSRKEYTNLMLSELDRLNNMVNQLLFIYKDKATNLQKVCLPNVIDEVIRLLKPKLDKNEITCSLESEQEGIHVLADASNLKQVIINLILNAVEASLPGNNISIRVYKEGKNVIAQIEDEGTGISQEELAKIFEPFYTTKEDGTGLGLYITKNIISSFGGSIRVVSSKGKGTIFFLEFSRT